MTDEMTYEEAAILKWYRARMAFETGGMSTNPTSLVKRQAILEELGAAEQELLQIGMDLNVKDQAE